MRSSPTVGCEISPNTEPLEVPYIEKHRWKATLKLYERVLLTHPCKIVVEKWKGLARLQQKSGLHVVKELEKSRRLPENRQKLQKAIRELPPHRNLYLTISKTFIVKENIESDPNALKQCICFGDWWSSFIVTVNAGYGPIVFHPDGQNDELSHPNFVDGKEAIANNLTCFLHRF